MKFEAPKNLFKAATAAVVGLSLVGGVAEAQTKTQPTQQTNPANPNPKYQYPPGYEDMLKAYQDIHVKSKGEGMKIKSKEDVFRVFDVISSAQLDYIELRKKISDVAGPHFSWSDKEPSDAYHKYAAEWLQNKINAIGKVDPNSPKVFEINRLERIKKEVLENITKK
jgi:hypothetical protein